MLDSAKLEITHSFINNHPRTVVSLLEKQNPRDVANLFRALSPEYRVKILEFMLPSYIGKLSELWSEAFFAAMLLQLPLVQQLSVLRCLALNKRDAIITKLPSEEQRNITEVLDYDLHLVGAWMNPQVEFIPSEDNAAAALARISNVENRQLHEPLFVIDRDRTILGKLSIYTLLKAAKQLPISSLIDDQITSLPANISLVVASKVHAWRTEQVLPVINTEAKVIGVLSYSVLNSGLELYNADSKTKVELTTMENLLANYCEVVENISSLCNNWDEPAHG